jgi:hypothetical protein
MTDFNDSLEELFAGDTGPVRSEAVVDRPAAIAYVAETTAPGYVQTCYKCRGTGQTRWGVCYACRGAGGKTFKTSPAARAKASEQRADLKGRREAEAIDAWKAENRAAYEWLVATAPRWELAASLLAGLQRYGSLTEKQMAIVTNGIARDAARAQERAQTAQAAPVVASAGIDRLKAAFDTAAAYIAANGLKRKTPKITIGGITISPAKAESKNPGALYVKDGGIYLGKIAGGQFFASRDCGEDSKTKVLRFVADPAEAATVYGQTTGTCCICNAELRSEWRLRGIGPVCAEKMGW